VNRSSTLPSILLFATGASALVYQLVWTRWLILALGAGTESLAIVVASTMLGFGLGGELLGKLGDRVERRLRLYGLLEVGVGVSALLVSLLLKGAAEQTVWASLPRLVGGVAALATIGVPSALMGATLPALAAHVASDPDALRAGVGRMYAANTSGAVLGVLATGLVLIARVGLFRSALVGVATNLAVGLVAILADRVPAGRRSARSRGIRSPSAQGSSPPLAPPSAPTGPAGLARSLPGGAALAALLGAAASGFTVMAAEVLDSRLLVHGLLGTQHAIVIILAAFLTGLALGAHLGAFHLRKRRALVGQLGLALLITAVLALALSPCLTRAGILVHALRGIDQRFRVRVLAEAAVAGGLLLPITTAMGCVFPAAAALYAAAARPGATVGRIVLVNTLCGVAGALSAGFVALPLLGLRGAVVAIALVQASAGAWLLGREPAWRGWRGGVGWAAAAALALAGVFWARPPRIGGQPGQGTLVPQHLAGREREHSVLCYREGIVATTTVLQHIWSGRHDLILDGFVAADDGPGAGYMRLMGRLPMRLHPSPRRALVICFGTGSTARAVGESEDAAIDLVDINPDVFACAPHFAAENERLLARVSRHIDDGRRFLRQDGPAYDVITQEPMPPYFAGTAALYSVEYYRLARRRLAPGGVLVQWLPLHLLAPSDARELVAAAQTVFPETWVVLTPKDKTALIVASATPLDADRRASVERELDVSFVLDPAAARRYSTGHAPLTDDHPTIEYSGVEHMYDRFRYATRLHAFNVEELLQASAPETARH
jgi:spermidine synthase